MNWYDFEGRWKVVTFAGSYACLCSPEVNFLQACEWYRNVLGRSPDFLAAQEVPEEFVDAFRDLYEAKGLLCEGENRSEL